MLLLIDFGLLVLIWMVQLLIYPSFLYFQSSDLLKWHHAYTPRITFIVLPMMLFQLLAHSWNVYASFSIVNVLLCVIVFATWLVTFLISVPLHHKIASNVAMKDACKLLIKTNWIRTVLWSFVFILHLLEEGIV